MNAFLDDLIVGALLLASVGYVALKLGPKPWKQRILQASSRVLGSAPASWRLGNAAQRLMSASGRNSGACGGCDNCGAESAPAPQSSGEINVPVAKIGRRA